MSAPLEPEHVRILHGDCRAVLATLPPKSVQTCVTSPPYWGLRKYLPGGHALAEQEIGQEPTIALYLEHLVAVFAAVHRVLRDDGTLWINIGDSYAAPGYGLQKPEQEIKRQQRKPGRQNLKGAFQYARQANRDINQGLGRKQLLGMPWRLAFALQDAGWILRADNVWAKSNPMPESTRDRPSRAHEYVFLLAKGAHPHVDRWAPGHRYVFLLAKRKSYHYDKVAVAEPVTGGAHARGDGVNPKATAYRTPTGWNTGPGSHNTIEGRYPRTQPSKQNPSFSAAVHALVEMRNLRSVWTLATQGYASAHFATFPEALAERCILAGTSPQACPHCGAPWKRQVHTTPMVIDHGPKAGSYGSNTTDGISGHMVQAARVATTGWLASCRCAGNDGSGRCVVLDPFCGSGTTLRVASRHGRAGIGIDLHPDYLDLQEERTHGVQMTLQSQI